MEKSDEEYLSNIDFAKSSWAKSLFRRMGFVKRTATTARPEITEGARKETESSTMRLCLRSKSTRFRIPWL